MGSFLDRHGIESRVRKAEWMSDDMSSFKKCLTVFMQWVDQMLDGAPLCFFQVFKRTMWAYGEQWKLPVLGSAGFYLLHARAFLSSFNSSLVAVRELLICWLLLLRLPGPGAQAQLQYTSLAAPQHEGPSWPRDRTLVPCTVRCSCMPDLWGKIKTWTKSQEEKNNESNYSWPLNNMGLNCMCPLTPGFLSLVNTTVLRSALLESADVVNQGWL